MIKNEYLVCLPAADRKNGENRIIASSTMLIPSVFVTSRHVVDDWLARFNIVNETEENKKLTNLERGIDLLHILDNKSTVVWRITKLTPLKDTDLAILWGASADGDNAKSFLDYIHSNQTLVDLHPPEEGSIVTSLGYPHIITEDTTAAKQHQFHLQLRKSSGKVTEVNLNGLGYGYSDPGFYCKAAVDGGMSGGPVFNSSGALCGINSRAFQPTDEHDFYSSWVSLLLPVFTTPITLAVESNPSREVSLLDLAKEDYIRVSGIEHCRKKSDEQYVWDFEQKFDCCSP